MFLATTRQCYDIAVIGGGLVGAAIAYERKLLDRGELRELVSGIGPAVAGAVYCPHDGHVNSLKLLRALHGALKMLGCVAGNVA